MEFHPGEHVVINPLRVKDWIMNEFESSLVLYNSSVSRVSSSIIDEQASRVLDHNKSAIDATDSIKDDALKMKDSLLKGDLERVGEILNRSWNSKKLLASSISNSSLDETIIAARRAGAYAAKISGAGGGGFMMFLVEPSRRLEVESVLAKRDGKLLPFRFSPRGAESWTVKS